MRLGPLARRYRDSLGGASPRAAHEEAADADGWVRQTLVFDGSRVAVAALLALSPDVEVLEPVELREDLAAVARQVIDRCQSTVADTCPTHA